MEERELHCPEERPLMGWRLFRVRPSEIGYVLSAPLMHSPDFEHFPSRTVAATCYQQDQPAPAPGCRCGLYTAIEGTLDSLAGYLRAQRIKVVRLAMATSLWSDPRQQAQAVAELCQRYGVDVCDLDVLPEWVVTNLMPQGAPPEDAVLDLDALLTNLGLQSS